MEGKTILAVDDDRTVLDVVGEILALHGYQPLLAGDGEEALQLAEESGEPIDLLLTDVVMPGLDGPELARRFQASYPETKILFMSAYLCPAMADQGSRGREEAFLLKPFYPDALIRKMKKILT